MPAEYLFKNWFIGNISRLLQDISAQTPSSPPGEVFLHDFPFEYQVRAKIMTWLCLRRQMRVLAVGKYHFSIFFKKNAKS
jgi:hypothetical protein